MLGFICTLCGIFYLFIAITCSESLTLFACILLVGGIFIYIIDSLIKVHIKSRFSYWTLQVLVSLVIVFANFLYYSSTNAHTNIVFSDENKEAVIIFGIKNYPPLPPTYFWVKTIIIPANGILVTSSLENDLPGYIRNITNLKGEKLERNIAFTRQLTVVNQYVFSSYYSSIECPYCDFNSIPNNHTSVQDLAYSIYESLINGKLESLVLDTGNYKILSNTNKGLIFEMSSCKSKWRGPIPDTISRLKIYSAVFSCNYIWRIPKSILNNPYIEELHMDNTRIDSLPKDINRMKSLRILDISNNNLVYIPASISELSKLEVLYLNNNKLSKRKIKTIRKLLPNTVIYADDET